MIRFASPVSARAGWSRLGVRLAARLFVVAALWLGTVPGQAQQGRWSRLVAPSAPVPRVQPRSPRLVHRVPVATGARQADPGAPPGLDAPYAAELFQPGAATAGAAPATPPTGQPLPRRLNRPTHLAIPPPVRAR